MFSWRNQNKWRERDTTSHKQEAEKLEFEVWLDFRNFRVWRMNFRSEVSSGASHPIEAKVWINETASAQSVADLNTSYMITGAKSQTNFEVLDFKKASGFMETIHQRRLQKKGHISRSSCKEKRISREGRSH